MKTSNENIISVIKQQGILPLFYHDDKEVSIAIVDALYNAGIRIVEYTNRGSNAAQNFEALLSIKDKRWPTLLLSVGTIKTVDAAKQFITLEADFIICPGVIAEVAKVVQDSGLLWVPGCLTPTEIITAEAFGAKLVKIFPGNLLGPSYVSAIKEIFPELMFMPTGGVEVNESNLKQWFNAGVVAVGLGSKVISKDLVDKKDYAAIEALARQALKIVQIIKS